MIVDLVDDSKTITNRVYIMNTKEIPEPFDRKKTYRHFQLECSSLLFWQDIHPSSIQRSAFPLSTSAFLLKMSSAQSLGSINTQTLPPAESKCAKKSLDIRFPQAGYPDLAQDEEWCEVVDENKTTRFRFHDYPRVFSHPGLYDQLFGGPTSETKCVSPQVLGGLLGEHIGQVLSNLEKNNQVAQNSITTTTTTTTRGANGYVNLETTTAVTTTKKPRLLRVLDFGAGNGMMGEQVRSLIQSFQHGRLAGSTTITAWDILPEAKAAAERDRPGVYDRYIVANIIDYARARKNPNTVVPGNSSVNTSSPAAAAATASPEPSLNDRQAHQPGPEESLPVLEAQTFNLLITASALSFGDASADALEAAISLVDEGGLIIFNLKAEVLEEPGSAAVDGSGTSQEGDDIKRQPQPTRQFSRLIQETSLEVLMTRRYLHRYSVTGQPLYYIAVVAVKRGTFGKSLA